MIPSTAKDKSLSHKAFDKWVNQKNFGEHLTTYPDGEYVDIRVRAAWSAWKAALEWKQGGTKCQE